MYVYGRIFCVVITAWGTTKDIARTGINNTMWQKTITFKMADKGKSDFYVALTVSLCSLELKLTSISLLFQALRLEN